MGAGTWMWDHQPIKQFVEFLSNQILFVKLVICVMIIDQLA